MRSTAATQVKTGQGFPVINATHLGAAVNNSGATLIDRCYFSCNGAGTEFTTGGEELWVTED